jgi:hypothetical protein
LGFSPGESPPIQAKLILLYCVAWALPQPAPHRGESAYKALIWEKPDIAGTHPKLPYFGRAFFLIWENEVIRSKLKLGFA